MSVKRISPNFERFCQAAISLYINSPSKRPNYDTGPSATRRSRNVLTGGGLYAALNHNGMFDKKMRARSFDQLLSGSGGMLLLFLLWNDVLSTV